MDRWTSDDGALVVAAVLGAFEHCGLDPLQQSMLVAIAHGLYGIDVDPGVPEASTPSIVPAPAARFAEYADPSLRKQAVSIMAVLEMAAHPLPRPMAAAVARYAHELGVSLGTLAADRARARHHGAIMYADFQRSSWYTKQTVHGSLHGHFLELAASKLSYAGVRNAPRVAEKWLALRDLPDGSWGRSVADFYEANNFPFPGTPHGIYEIGAKHDFVHVLTDYGPTPEGELDVFGFIATSMPPGDGIVLLAVAMALFQNGAIRHVAGKRVKIARSDTLTDPGAVDRFADAMRRGAATTVDVMGGIDHFTLAPLPLDEVREQCGVLPPHEPSAG